MTKGDPSGSRAALEPDSTAQGGGPESRAPVGEYVVHLNSGKQVAGSTVYLDDFPEPPGILHAALVLSSQPYARISSVHDGHGPRPRHCPGSEGLV